MAPDPSPDDVVVETWIAAPPEEVFPYLTDPRLMVRWFGVVADVDARPGGIFHVQVNGRDWATGCYIEVSPPRRVAFTWGWEDSGHGVLHGLPPGSTTVTIDLVPENGGTRVTLRHAGLAGDLARDHERGWTHYAARLKTVGEGGDPGPDPFVKAAASRPATS